MNAKRVMDGRGSGVKSLKGSDLPERTMEVTVHVLKVKEPPAGFSAIGVMDIEKTYGMDSFPLNITNWKKMIELLGSETDDWEGADVTLEKYKVNNPKTGEMVWSLMVQSAKARKGAKKK